MIEFPAPAVLVALAVAVATAWWWYMARSARKWRALRDAALAQLAPGKARPNQRTFWILTNPIGGNRQGPRIFEEVLQPLLEKAGLRYKLITTTHAGHAREIAAAVDEHEVAALVLISGDGMVHEALQGFAEKCDHDSAKMAALCQAVPLGLIPGGSSNGLSTSFGHDIVRGCLGVVDGVALPLDVSEIDMGAPGSAQHVKLWDVHAFCFGAIADHDRLVESKLRRLGVVLKSLVAVAVVLLRGREYRCRLEFKDASTPDLQGKGFNDAAALSTAGGWRVLQGSFIGLNALNTTWGASDMLISPHAERAGGTVDLLIVRSATRLALLKVFMGLETGDHLQAEFVELYRASAWRILPDVAADGARTTLDVSGEQFPLRAASAKVHQSMARVLSVPVE